MSLQELIKDKINEFGGIDKLRVKVELLEPKIDAETEDSIKQLMLFYNMTFWITIDMVKDTIKLRYFFERMIETLYDANKTHHDSTLDFLIDLIQTLK